MARISPTPWIENDGDVVDANGEVVALVYPEDGREKRWWFECGTRNASLMAAAPDLLRELSAAYTAIKMRADPSFKPDQDLLRCMDTAMKKARGR